MTLFEIKKNRSIVENKKKKKNRKVYVRIKRFFIFFFREKHFIIFNFKYSIIL